MDRLQDGPDDGPYELLTPEDFLPANRMPLADRRREPQPMKAWA